MVSLILTEFVKVYRRRVPGHGWWDRKVFLTLIGFWDQDIVTGVNSCWGVGRESSGSKENRDVLPPVLRQYNAPPVTV